MNWHTRITEAREAKGLSKAQLARDCGVSSPTVTDWESGKIKNLDAANMLRICKILGVDPNWLVFGIPKSPKRNEFSALSNEAQNLIKWVIQLDALGDPALKTFELHAALLQVAHDLMQEHHLDVVRELEMHEQILAPHSQTPGARHATDKRKP